jgi:hypothetical protein
VRSLNEKKLLFCKKNVANKKRGENHLVCLDFGNVAVMQNL